MSFTPKTDTKAVTMVEAIKEDWRVVKMERLERHPLISTLVK